MNEKLEKRLSCKSSFAQPSSLLFVLFFLFVILRNIVITMKRQPSSLLFVLFFLFVILRYIMITMDICIMQPSSLLFCILFFLCHSKTYDNNHRYINKNLLIVHILFLFVKEHNDNHVDKNPPLYCSCSFSC